MEANLLQLIAISNITKSWFNVQETKSFLQAELRRSRKINLESSPSTDQMRAVVNIKRAIRYYDDLLSRRSAVLNRTSIPFFNLRS
jgi:hypothetical protein